MYNPSLREEPREQLAEVIPLKQESSLLDWLESNNRLIARENSEETDPYDEDEEISDLMGTDNDQYDEDDSDDLVEDE